MPLVDFYNDKGILIKVNGEGDVHKIFEDIKERLYDKKKGNIG